MIGGGPLFRENGARVGLGVDHVGSVCVVQRNGVVNANERIAGRLQIRHRFSADLANVQQQQLVSTVTKPDRTDSSLFRNAEIIFSIWISSAWLTYL